MASTTPQRVYRAPCPGCGAPVEFRSAQSTHAVCGYCRSTVVRDGDTLSRLGKMAELFDDHSPLQLLASGRFQDRAFTVVGRLQYRGPSGPWTEWHAAFDDGTTGWLAEDNGAYVFALAGESKRELPAADQFRVGRTTAINGKQFRVASNETVALVSAQGELPRLPPLNQPFAMVELRSTDGEVLALDYGATPPTVTRGRSVNLDDLQLTGLKDEVARDGKGRQFDCPHCGAPVEPKLSTSKSITCGSCHALIDLTAGVGGELQHALQDEPVEPLIPLGSTGQLQGTHWQVVGYQHRLGHEPGDDDEHFGWDEYLLYNRKRGFVFLVDSTEGWSVVKPTTGVPVWVAGGSTATYLGGNYRLKDSYHAETTYVAGEFYWPVERGQKTFNRDFEKGDDLLSLEENPREQVWSAGRKISSALVAQAFGLKDRMPAISRSDAAPTSSSGGMGCGTILLILFVLFILIAVLKGCDDCDPRYENCSSGSGSSYRSSGGSWGGYSSGGGHK